MQHLTRRRALLAALAGLCSSSTTIHGAAVAPAPPAARSADPRHRLQFPRDHGSHPEFRIEWWYATGWLQDVNNRDLGFQVTFFRAKPALRPGNPSAFNPEHVIIAHAALADPALGRQVHSQRAARAVFGLAGADTATTRVWLDDWQLVRLDNAYHARISDAVLTLDLRLSLTQPLLAHGVNGYSRKGPQPDAASHYYSAPQLQVAGSVSIRNAARKVSGKAWLDHEWSSSYLPDRAAGWDWIGINLDDGGALMAFRMREVGSGRALWAAATLRSAAGHSRDFAADAVRFTVLREWQSPRTGSRYPVEFRVEIPGLAIRIEPLMEDQENDTRATTGAVYWEGAVRAFSGGKRIGAGYLELTGYGETLVL